MAITKTARLRVGVDNLFNKAPPLVGVDSNPQTATTGNLSGDADKAQFYNGNGRRFYIGASFKF